MSIKQGMPGRQRRRHSTEFKARLIEECRRPGVSMASVAMANGVNANLLRNWVVRDGKHLREGEILTRFKAAIDRLMR